MGQMESYNYIQIGTQHKSLDKGADSKSSGTNHKTKRASWGDVAGRFCDPRECLASYLALETAEVIAGVKPANLVSVPNRTHSCGSNPYTYWKKWGCEVTMAAQLKSYTLKDRGNSVLIFLYRKDVLAELLAKPAVRAMLRRAGYSGQMDISELFDTFAQRMNSGTCPHDIGISLGYPLKDVAGFMGLARISFTCQEPWKIFGDPGTSLKLADTFRWCRKQMAEDLAHCSSPFECFEYYKSKCAFFCPPVDIDFTCTIWDASPRRWRPWKGGNRLNAAKEYHQRGAYGGTTRTHYRP